METVKCCPCCDSTETQLFLKQNSVPVHQNLVFAGKSEAQKINRGDLQLMVCGNCGFVFNASFDPALMGYGADYDNVQTCSGMFRKHVDDLAEYLIHHAQIQKSQIIEVGCGNGFFLKSLLTKPGGEKNRGLGFDPSYTGPETELDGRMQFIDAYYGPDFSHFQADAVICRHVIEHVPAPMVLLNSIRSALASSPNARVFFETPCVEWILKNTVIWDFFYEHCSYFNKESLKNIFQRAGFQVDEVRHVFGGQYLWLEATPVAEKLPAQNNSVDMLALAEQYAVKANQLSQFWRERILEIQAETPVAIWGAGAKGVTFANLVDPEAEIIDCLVDLNPNKQGKFVAGTGHPIVDYYSLKERGVKKAILMNPNYRDENVILLQEAGISLDFISLEGENCETHN